MALKAVRTIEPHTTKTGVSLADLLGKSRMVDVPFPGGLSLCVTYDPGKATSRLVEFDPANPDPDVMAKAVCKVVTAWDLTDCPHVGPGHEDTVASTVPIEILGLVIKAINEDTQLNPQKSGQLTP